MRRTLTSSGVLHSLTRSQYEHLELIFAYLTPNGWAIPAWLKELAS